MCSKLLKLLSFFLFANTALAQTPTTIRGERDDTATQTAAEGAQLTLRETQYRALHVNLRNASGSELGTPANPLEVDGSLTCSIPGAVSVAEPVSVDDDGGSLTVDNPVLSVVGGGAEATAQRVTIADDSTGVLSVDDNGSSLTVDGSVTIQEPLSVDDNGGSLTVDGSVLIQEPLGVDDDGGSLTVDAVSWPLPTGAATAANQLPDGHNVTVDNASIPVTQSGTWDINDITGTISLPTGAATAANQLPDGHNVTVDNVGGAAAVNIQDGGNSITVDGTVAVSGGSITVQEPLSVDDDGGSLTVDNPVLSVVGGGAEATALRVTIANDSTGVLSVDDNSSTISVDDGAGSLTVDGTVAATQSGTWNINNVSGTVSLPTGAATSALQTTGNTTLSTIATNTSNTNNKFTAAAALADGQANPTTTRTGAALQVFNGTTWDRARGDITNGLDVDVTRIVPGTGATSLGKAEDDVHVSGDTGVMSLSVRQDTATALAGTSGDYQPLITTANGRLHTADTRTSSSAQNIQGSEASGGALGNPITIAGTNFAGGTRLIPTIFPSGGINYLLALNPDPGLHFIDYTPIGEIYSLAASTDGAKTGATYIKLNSSQQVENAVRRGGNTTLVSAQTYNNVTTTTTSSSVDVQAYRTGFLYYSLTKANTPTDIELQLQGSYNNSTWFDFGDGFENELLFDDTAVGSGLNEVVRIHDLPKYIRLVVTATGTTAANTFTLTSVWSMVD